VRDSRGKKGMGEGKKRGRMKTEGEENSNNQGMNDWPAQRVPPEAPAERTRKVGAAEGGETSRVRRSWEKAREIKTTVFCVPKNQRFASVQQGQQGYEFFLIFISTGYWFVDPVCIY